MSAFGIIRIRDAKRLSSNIKQACRYKSSSTENKRERNNRSDRRANTTHVWSNDRYYYVLLQSECVVCFGYVTTGAYGEKSVFRDTCMPLNLKHCTNTHKQTHTQSLTQKSKFEKCAVLRSTLKSEYKKDAEVVCCVCDPIERNLGGHGLTCTTCTDRNVTKQCCTHLMCEAVPVCMLCFSLGSTYFECNTECTFAEMNRLRLIKLNTNTIE